MHEINCMRYLLALKYHENYQLRIGERWRHLFPFQEYEVIKKGTLLYSAPIVNRFLSSISVAQNSVFTYSVRCVWFSVDLHVLVLRCKHLVVRPLSSRQIRGFPALNFQ